jgi:hypothetical protein
MGDFGIGAIAGIAQGAVGLGQMLFSGRKKAEKELNALKTPTYSGSTPVSTFYQNALQRFNVAPTQSAIYKRQQNNIMRNTASGLGALRGRGGALAGVNKLVAGSNDASLNAEAAAENQQNQRFAQLGGATNMQLADDRFKYNINELMPFQRKDRLAQMKLAAANARFDAGLQNLAGGAQTAAFGIKKK